jgi:hypothetical protein
MATPCHTPMPSNPSGPIPKTERQKDCNLTFCLGFFHLVCIAINEETKKPIPERQLTLFGREQAPL